MSNNNQNDIVLGIIAVILVILGVTVWKFSQFLGLDLETGFSVFIKVLAVVVCWFVINKIFLLSFSRTWLFALAFLWLSFSPALNYWSQEATADIPSPTYLFNDQLVSQEAMWYATWYFKLFVFSILCTLGWYTNRD